MENDFILIQYIGLFYLNFLDHVVMWCKYDCIFQKGVLNIFSRLFIYKYHYIFIFVLLSYILRYWPHGFDLFVCLLSFICLFEKLFHFLFFFIMIMAIYFIIYAPLFYVLISLINFHFYILKCLFYFCNYYYYFSLTYVNLNVYNSIVLICFL